MSDNLSVFGNIVSITEHPHRSPRRSQNVEHACHFTWFLKTSFSYKMLLLVSTPSLSGTSGLAESATDIEKSRYVDRDKSIYVDKNSMISGVCAL